MTSAKGYSLWLMPTGDVYRRLSQIIFELSRKYETPNFEPHVTLLGEIETSQEEIVEKTRDLASSLRSFSIQLTGIGYLQQYFRCLFLKAKESYELMQANRQAREVFNRQQDPIFMPHLSLMYGDFQPEIKNTIIKDIGEINLQFEVRTLHLFSTDGRPKNWYRVDEFEFNLS